MKDNRTPLRKAVDTLIANGKIKQDKDLQGIFNLSKSTISAYLNNPKPGKKFLIDFEKKFGISFNEFEDSSSGSSNSDVENLKAHIKTLENHCGFLQKTFEEKLSNLEGLLKKSETNLENVLINQDRFRRELAVAFRLVLKEVIGENEQRLQEVSNKFDKLTTALDV